MPDCCFDLRQYTLEPGRRDDLIELFEAHFVAGQEAVGMHVVGHFRDLDDPDRFVWIRAFDSYEARGRALPAFYHGPVWRAHREAANDTMIDSDDALLLKPLSFGPGYPAAPSPRPSRCESDAVVAVTIAYRDRPIDDAFAMLVLDRVVPEIGAAGGEPLAVLFTDRSMNNFAALPLRDENVVAWISRFDDDATYDDYRARLCGSSAWRDAVAPQLNETARLQELRLRPAAGSHLR